MTSYETVWGFQAPLLIKKCSYKHSENCRWSNRRVWKIKNIFFLSLSCCSSISTFKDFVTICVNLLRFFKSLSGNLLVISSILNKSINAEMWRLSVNVLFSLEFVLFGDLTPCTIKERGLLLRTHLACGAQSKKVKNEKVEESVIFE